MFYHECRPQERVVEEVYYYDEVSLLWSWFFILYNSIYRYFIPPLSPTLTIQVSCLQDSGYLVILLSCLHSVSGTVDLDVEEEVWRFGLTCVEPSVRGDSNRVTSTWSPRSSSRFVPCWKIIPVISSGGRVMRVGKFDPNFWLPSLHQKN